MRIITILSVVFLLSTGCSQAQETGTKIQDNEIKKITKSEAEWKAELTEEEYHVLREKGTEPAFSGKYNDWKKKGIFVCAACGLPLFTSDDKFDSGTGWPSFYDTYNDQNVMEREDNSLGMNRTEVLCARCESHLGHVFKDGPQPTGLRYCINSVALDFKKK